MKGIFRKLGFHKMDELERHITFKAQRNSYFFLVISLLIWSFYESYKVYTYHTRLNLLPCLLLVGAVAIQNISQLIMTRSAVKDNEDSYEATRILKTVILICVIVSVILVIITKTLI